MFSKFYFDFLEKNLTIQESNFLVGQIDNLRSNLIKNALLFLQELVRDKRNRDLAGFLKMPVQATLTKTTYEK